MNETTMNYRGYGVDRSAGSRIVLTERPDMRAVTLGLLIPVLIVIAGLIASRIPTVHWSVIVLSFGGALLVALAKTLSMFEALVKARYTVTTDYIESEKGLFDKTVRTIPLSYVRDVTYEQGFIQARYGLSDITVSATNGDKIVLEQIRDGRQKRDIIWNLVLSNSPVTTRET
jgi:membrane protein YdbS with pleckstrin-like domain